MTIKETEALTEMTRANIRFYESEGLLSPARNSNGYRDYSENDLEVLKRIKLLRTLHISLEEIKSLQTGDRELTDALDQHLEKLKSEKTDLEQSQEICKVMRSDGVRYQTLDAQHYLDEMKDVMHRLAPELAADTVPKVRSPWRRFFARSLDLFIYASLWRAFLSVVMNINIGIRSGGLDLLNAIAASLLMIFIEPAMLSVFGTTVGKWILGLSVTSNDDRRLPYSEALSRTWTVFCLGMGLNIPIFNLVRYWKSYKACDEGETLDWEYHSAMTLRDGKVWRAGAYIGVYAVVFALLFLAISMAEMPKHRGEITVAEFCENYNRLSDYYKSDTACSLDGNGKWVESENTDHVISIGGIVHEPEFIFSEENGVMTGMEFSAELHNSDAWAPSYQEEMILSILSFVRAQKEYSPFSNDVKDMIEQIAQSPFENFKFTAHGVSIACEVEYSGYMNTASSGSLWPEDGAETDYSFQFVMRK